jgi:hypothetical protein
MLTQPDRLCVSVLGVFRWDPWEALYWPGLQGLKPIVSHESAK